ncbi:unnamed protein product [Caenorhabditis brenneri]
MVYVKSCLRRADNFMYIVKKNAAARKAFLVDLVNEENYQDLAEKENIDITGVLTTHHHYDHCGGNEGFRRQFPNIPIFGGDDRVPGMDRRVKHDEVAELADLKIKCLLTPCHTSGHVCYLVSNPSDESDTPVVFTGDTLFIAGCGRFFEGTATQMDTALNKILKPLPEDTLVYPGHEYTLANLKFAAFVEPHNPEVAAKLKWATEQRENGAFTVPSTIFEEKATNPFMRVIESESIQKRVDTDDPIEGMERLRSMKNQF